MTPADATPVAAAEHEARHGLFHDPLADWTNFRRDLRAFVGAHWRAR